MSDMTPCPVCGDTEGSSRMGVEVRGVYDGICYWTCMKCGARWHRFPEGDRRRGAVEDTWAVGDAEIARREAAAENSG